MSELLNHRLTRYLRAVLSGSILLQGLFASWSPASALAASRDTMTLGVSPTSNAPPAAVTDLLASPNPAVQGELALSWTAPQGNAGGTPVANWPVASYSIHFATFSVASLAGDTTSWWNATTANAIALQPPAFTPQVPGQWDAYALNNLTPNVTYYFGIKSTSQGGVLSPIDTESSTPGSQAQGIPTGFLQPPASFAGTALSISSILWTWQRVPGATNYLVYSDPGNTLLKALSDPTTSWIEVGLAANTAYSRKAQSTNATQQSVYSSVETRYTLAKAPLSLAVTATSAHTISLAWDTNSNPIATTFSLERGLDGVSFTPVVSSTGSTVQDTGLAGGTLYYYRLRALNGDQIGTAYTAVVSARTAASSAPPMKPSGVLATLVANNIFVFSWRPVTLDTSGTSVVLDHYEINRYLAIASTPTAITVAGGSASYNVALDGTLYYYRVRAVNSEGVASEWSDYVDCSPKANRYSIASDDLDTRVVIPHDVALELLAENNVFGKDLELRFARQRQDEVDATLRSYHISAFQSASGLEAPNFAFSKSLISVQLGYGSVIGSGRLTTTQVLALQTPDHNTAGSIAQIIAVWWNNGLTFVRVSDPVLTSNQALSVTVRNLGTYQIRATTLGNAFKLTKGSPYPRVITPNDPTQNNRVFFFFDNPTDESVAGTIYDIRGAKVRDLHVDGMSPTSSSLVWDGRDSQGSVVPSGVYLYKVQAGKESVTGTIVVAR